MKIKLCTVHTSTIQKANPTYEEVEPLIDSIMEFVHFRKEMTTEDPNEISFIDSQDKLSRVK